MRRLEMSDAFALVLRKHRKAKGLSQELLAEKADLHPTYIGLVERRLRNPSLNTAKALALGLGLTILPIFSDLGTLLHNMQQLAMSSEEASTPAAAACRRRANADTRTARTPARDPRPARGTGGSPVI